MPYFWPGMIFLVLFGTTLHWFPAFGMETAGATYSGPFDQIIDIGSHLVLPVITVALGLIGEYSLLMRSSLIEVLAEDYVTDGARQGPDRWPRPAPPRLPNAMLPMVTIIAINAGYIIAGAITIEVVFSWPGLGTLTVRRCPPATTRSFRALPAAVSVSVVVANLISDLIYGFLDPRVKA
jgi:peptide/nickel transport system permease protein